MKRRVQLVLIAAAMAGCTAYRPADVVIAGEAVKLRSVELGMTIQEVEAIMGTDDLVLGYMQPEARPVRTDKFVTRDGKKVTIYFYRSSTKRRDDMTTDDETTAVLFVNGKVDSVMPGENSKSVVEVRFR